MKNSKDYLKFLDSFGEDVCNSKSGLMADTIFKYNGSFNQSNYKYFFWKVVSFLLISS